MAEKVQHCAKTAGAKRENSASRTKKMDQSQSMSSPVDQVMYLQRTIGNQAVQRLIRSGALQAKLKIGQPGDKYEHEADRVADAVMLMPEPQVQQYPIEEEEEEQIQTKSVTEQITPFVQKEVEEEKNDELCRQPIEEEKEELQAKATSGNIPEANPILESHIHSLKGGGQPLSENDRTFFEPRFGRDFRQVRLHTDANAVESARAVNARAFTIGSDVVFGEGEYTLGTSERRRLLGHELTHVIQQQNRILQDGNNIQRLGEDRPFIGPLSQFTSPTTIIGSIMGRPLNSREIGVLVPVFGPHLNYFAIRICEAGICSPDRIPRTIGNIIGVPAGFNDNTLIHESAHIWQHQNGVPFGYAVDALTAQLASWLVTGSRLGAYNYSFLERWHIPWRFWNAEQQASWIEDNRRLPSFLVWGVGRGMLPP